MKAIFLDRDGVINQYPGDTEYVKSWKEFHFLPKVKPALKKLNEHGFRLFIISNQAGIARGIYPQKELDLITENMLRQLKKVGVDISGVFYCTHRKEDNCSCRKPRTGLIELAISKLQKEGAHIRIKDSYFIGDTLSDIETGKSAGLRTILVFSGKEQAQNKDNWQLLPDFTCQDLSQAVRIILNK